MTTISVIHVSRASEVPKVPHYAIITTTQGTEPGYDKNDPPSSFYYTRYVAYLDRTEWATEVKRLVTDKSNFIQKDFIAVYVQPASINVDVTVDVKVKDRLDSASR